MFTEKDFQQIHNKGITIDDVNNQVSRLKNGMSYSKLLAAATIKRGIERYSDEEVQSYIELYLAKKNSLSIVKFVPASGAATRMFKFLFGFLKNFNSEKESLKAFIKRENDDLLEIFFSNLKRFPFYDEVIDKIKETNPGFETFSYDKKCVVFAKTMLSDKVLNYSFFPKGLLPFHKYGKNVVSAFREHLLESTLYASSNGRAKLHFTVSERHLNYFESEFNIVRKDLENETGIQFDVSYSFQKEATETVALTTANNSVLRHDDGSILFRPAGHGALLENLNDLDNDLIFIKNIDNIPVLEKNKYISRYKKLLAGVLLSVQETIFEHLETLDSKDSTSADLKIIALFLVHRLNVVIPSDFEKFSLESQRTYLREKLDRPIRVCGMVKNQGQPGGGPFWVKDEDDNISMQIVEFAQINFSNKEQQAIVYKATHFNPTDVVCGVKNYKGVKFNLKNYVDPNAAFITMKTHKGINIKALELPGLWNGSMAHWNSIFIEVPLETFNPVKTVNDLLNDAHQVL